MEKFVAEISKIPAGKVAVLNDISFDEMKQVLRMYADTHSFKLFGVECCTFHGIMVFVKELPMCTVSPNLGRFSDKKVADYYDHSRQWYVFNGRSQAKYSLMVRNTPPTEKAPRNICDPEPDPEEDEFNDLLMYVVGGGELSNFSDAAILHYYENSMVPEIPLEERVPMDNEEDQDDIPERTPAEEARHLSILERAEAIIAAKKKESNS